MIIKDEIHAERNEYDTWKITYPNGEVRYCYKRETARNESVKKQATITCLF